ncbi:TPA: hypothetical protein ACPZP6_003207 [Yersinia enterocolitica]|uniref:hypothetical protein n=1 Tax=Yersinia enterocolitica TaxID=630 RepID=UPI0005E691E3|nr:hypothetical protein [Yersinia enterocolitica]ELI8280877.1 hypothetical protein [Yersinia enterocolitica]CQH26639.1 Uncharacterized protein encoded in hypervariable junctions of pilus gene clusters [Yersinia enterocolitica]HEN3461339.1 hypothetical protein [Yersinia enterocolitica]
MNITMKINGYTATITIDTELQMFRGEFIELNGSVDFYAYSMVGLKKEGVSLEAFSDKYIDMWSLSLLPINNKCYEPTFTSINSLIIRG